MFVAVAGLEPATPPRLGESIMTDCENRTHAVRSIHVARCGVPDRECSGIFMPAISPSAFSWKLYGIVQLRDLEIIFFPKTATAGGSRCETQAPVFDTFAIVTPGAIYLSIQGEIKACMSNCKSPVNIWKTKKIMRYRHL